MSRRLELKKLGVSYGAKIALRDVSFDVQPNTLTAIVGPANAGKTTLLRCINRTIDFVPKAIVSGELLLDGESVLAMRDVIGLRRRVGMVLPLPVGLPLTVYDNVAFAPRAQGLRNKAELDVLVESCLRKAVLWDEVKDRLELLGTRLSGGQQQRLTLARALSLQPEILCLDEFSIAIDPVTTMKIEEVLVELKSELTILMVTNRSFQARRLADYTVFLNASVLVEHGETRALFDAPKSELTAQYLSGAIG